MLNAEQTTRLATLFRDAIEKCDPAALGLAFANFPRGSCGDAALLLSRFLGERGAVHVHHLSGERGEGATWQSHAWL